MMLHKVRKPAFLFVVFLAFANSSEPARTAVLDPQFGSDELSETGESDKNLALPSVQAGAVPAGSSLLRTAIPPERLSVPTGFAPDIMLLPGSSDPANVAPQFPLLRQPAEAPVTEPGPASMVRTGIEPGTARNDIRGERTVRDVLRSYVNVRRSSASPASGRPAGERIGGSGSDDRNGTGIGLGLTGAILDLSADSLVGQLIQIALEPSIHIDGSVTFSVFGLGSFSADVTRGTDALQVVDLGSGRSVLRMSRTGIPGGDPSRSALPRRKVTVSIKEFVLSMAGDLLRTPIFYVIVFAVLGLGVYSRTRPN